MIIDINWNTIKSHLIFFASGIIVTIIGFIIIEKSKPERNETDVITPTNIIVISNYAPTFTNKNCQEVIDAYNSYVKGTPKYLSNYSPNCIDFSLSYSSYRMCLNIKEDTEKIYWKAGIGYFFNNGIAGSLGINYYIFDGSVLLLTGLPKEFKLDLGIQGSIRFNF